MLHKEDNVCKILNNSWRRDLPNESITLQLTWSSHDIFVLIWSIAYQSLQNT